jgi:hypothetical protein
VASAWQSANKGMSVYPFSFFCYMINIIIIHHFLFFISARSAFLVSTIHQFAAPWSSLVVMEAMEAG